MTEIEQSTQGRKTKIKNHGAFLQVYLRQWQCSLLTLSILDKLIAGKEPRRKAQYCMVTNIINNNNNNNKKSSFFSNQY